MSLLTDARDRILSNVQRVQSLVIPHLRGNGVRVNHENPSYTWRDLEGPIRPKATGVGSPSRTQLRGNIYDYAFTTGDVCDLIWHWPHDYVPQSDAWIHLHWLHVGTAISGSLSVSYRHSWAKGHKQALVPSDTELVHSISTPNVATIPQWQDQIDEIQLSSLTPSASQIDSNDLEPDGLLRASLIVNTLPTISGGTTPKVFISYVDIHYLSTNVGTVARSPDFYVPH